MWAQDALKGSSLCKWPLRPLKPNEVALEPQADVLIFARAKGWFLGALRDGAKPVRLDALGIFPQSVIHITDRSLPQDQQLDLTNVPVPVPENPVHKTNVEELKRIASQTSEDSEFKFTSVEDFAFEPDEFPMIPTYRDDEDLTRVAQTPPLPRLPRRVDSRTITRVAEAITDLDVSDDVLRDRLKEMASLSDRALWTLADKIELMKAQIDEESSEDNSDHEITRSRSLQ